MKIIYQADDGNQFSSKKDCEQYEINSIQLKDIIPGAKFEAKNHSWVPYTTIIKIFPDLYLASGVGGNQFECFSNFSKPITLTEMFEYIRTNYKKVS